MNYKQGKGWAQAKAYAVASDRIAEARPSHIFDWQDNARKRAL